MSVAPHSSAILPASTTSRSLSALKLDDDSKFTGSNFKAFRDEFSLLLDFLDLGYILSDDVSQAPANLNATTRARDNRLVYISLHLNINETAKSIISDFSASKDGKEAWKRFVEQFGQPDTGTTISLLQDYENLKWEGGSIESFMDFLAKFQGTVRDLKERGVDQPGWLLGCHLVGKTPADLFQSAADLSIQTPTSVKLESVINHIQSTLSLRDRQSQTALLNQENRSTKKKSETKKEGGKKDDKKEPYRDPCSTCKDKLKLPEEKCRHPTDKCYNATRFATLLQAMEKKMELAMVADHQESTTEMETLYMASTVPLTSISTRQEWVVDTGCTVSMTPDASILSDYRKMSNQTVRVGDNNVIPVEGVGSVGFTGNNGRKYRMGRVLHVPAIACNLLSIRAFTSKGATLSIAGTSLVIKDVDGSHIILGNLNENLYRSKLALTEGSSHPAPETCLLTSAVLQHRRFGHVDLSKAGGIELESCGSSCDACIRGKFRRLPFNGTPTPITTPLAQVHADLFGPTRTPTLTGAKYLCVFVDVATGYTKGYWLRAKSETVGVFIQYKA